MVEPLSPLAQVYKPGRHGHVAEGIGVTLTEPQPGTIVQAAAWPGREEALVAALNRASGLSLNTTPRTGSVAKAASGFGIGPGRYLILSEDDALASALAKAVDEDTGTVTDLTHGRTVMRIEGQKSEWVLSKLFAIDFRNASFGVGSGVATSHHEVFAQIQRTAPQRFDIIVFRSFARSFWKTLCHAAEETGYEVI